jgi:phosphotransferase system enzyme I (PtsP)
LPPTARTKLAERYDWLSPAILRFLRRVSRTCQEHGTLLTVCGEMGGRQVEALALLGLGIRRLSITPAAVGPIKSMVCQVNLPEIEAEMNRLLDEPAADLRGQLLAWAQARGITFD